MESYSDTLPGLVVGKYYEVERTFTGVDDGFVADTARFTMMVDPDDAMEDAVVALEVTEASSDDGQILNTNSDSEGAIVVLFKISAETAEALVAGYTYYWDIEISTSLGLPQSPALGTAVPLPRISK